MTVQLKGPTTPNDELDILLNLDSAQAIVLNNRLCLLFPRLEKDNPALLMDHEYRLAKCFFLRAERESIGNGYALEKNYERLSGLLNSKKLKTNPFSATFAEVIEKFQSDMATNAETDAIEDAAQAIILGEIREGVDFNLADLRKEIKREILKALYYDEQEKAIIDTIISTYGLDKMFALFALSDKKLTDLGGDNSQVQDYTVVEMIENGRAADGFILSSRMLDQLDDEDRVDLQNKRSVKINVFTIILKARKDLRMATHDEERLRSAKTVLTKQPKPQLKLVTP